MDNPDRVETQATLVESLAQQGYAAYGSVTDHKNYQGLPTPEWIDLPDRIKEAWAAAAHCVASLIKSDYANAQAKTGWRYAFDERQLKEIEFCRVYADSYAHGTDGHNAKLIIATLARLLDANDAEALPF